MEVLSLRLNLHVTIHVNIDSMNLVLQYIAAITITIRCLKQTEGIVLADRQRPQRDPSRPGSPHTSGT